MSGENSPGSHAAGQKADSAVHRLASINARRTLPIGPPRNCRIQMQSPRYARFAPYISCRLGFSRSDHRPIFQDKRASITSGQTHFRSKDRRASSLFFLLSTNDRRSRLKQEQQKPPNHRRQESQSNDRGSEEAKGKQEERKHSPCVDRSAKPRKSENRGKSKRSATASNRDGSPESARFPATFKPSARGPQRRGPLITNLAG